MAENTESKISNPQSLRVLIVEDSEDDMLLIIRELEKGGYNPVYERVDTSAAMSNALKEKQWDIRQDRRGYCFRVHALGCPRLYHEGYLVPSLPGHIQRNR